MATIAGGGTPKEAGPAAAVLRVHRERHHLETLTLGQALGAAHIEGTGDQKDVRGMRREMTIKMDLRQLTRVLRSAKTLTVIKRSIA